MKFSLMSRAAVAALAAAGASAPADDTDAGPEPGQGGTDANPAPTPAPAPAPTPAPTPAPAPAPSQGDTPADAAGGVTHVVAAADAQALIAEADGKGFARANARMSEVFASEEGKANPSLAAFMLANSHASAADIVGQMKAQGVKPAAAASTAPVIPNTGVNIGTDAQALANEGGTSASDADKGWDAALATQAASRAPIVPAQHAGAQGTVTTSPAIPRTGN